MTPEQNKGVIVRQDQESVDQSIMQMGSPNLNAFTPSFRPPDVGREKAEAIYRVLTNPTIPVP